jgi:hypothetical protein
MNIFPAAALGSRTGGVTVLVNCKNLLWGLTYDGHQDTAGNSTNSEEDEIHRKGIESILVGHYEKFAMLCVW